MISICDDLRKSVLQAAIQGRLTQQLPEDGSAEDLYNEIQNEKQRLIKEGKIKKEKPLPEITEDDIPFDIPENWKWVYLNDIAFVTKLAGFEYTQYIAPNITSSGIPLIKGKNIQQGKFIDNFESYIPKNVSDNLMRSKVSKKCLLTPYVGTIGNIAIFEGNFPAHLGSNVGKIELFNDCTERVNVEYIYFFLRSDRGYKELSKYKKATAQESISIEAIRNVILPLPPLAEQKRIVSRVDELMARIDEMEKTEKDITTLYDAFPGDMKAALLQAAIQGKLTEQLASDGDAETLYADIQKEKQRLIEEGKLKKEKPLPEITENDIPFDIPENWKWVRIGEVGSLIRGSGIKKNETTKIGKPCVRYGEIYTSYLLQFYYAKTCTSEAVFSKCKQIKAGDLIFTLTGENKPDIAKTIAYLGDDRIAVGGDLAIWSNHCCYPKYLSYFMYSSFAIGQKVAAAAGDIIVHISCDKVSHFLMPLPPLAEQKRIVEKLDQLLPLCDAMNAEIAGGESV